MADPRPRQPAHPPPHPPLGRLSPLALGMPPHACLCLSPHSCLPSCLPLMPPLCGRRRAPRAVPALESTSPQSISDFNQPPKGTSSASQQQKILSSFRMPSTLRIAAVAGLAATTDALVIGARAPAQVRTAGPDMMSRFHGYEWGTPEKIAIFNEFNPDEKRGFDNFNPFERDDNGSMCDPNGVFPGEPGCAYMRLRPYHSPKHSLDPNILSLVSLSYPPLARPSHSQLQDPHPPRCVLGDPAGERQADRRAQGGRQVDREGQAGQLELEVEGWPWRHPRGRPGAHHLSGKRMCERRLSVPVGAQTLCLSREWARVGCALLCCVNPLFCSRLVDVVCPRVRVSASL